MINLGNIPILGQKDKQENRIKELEQALKSAQKSLVYARSLIQDLQAKKSSLIAITRWFLCQLEPRRIRISIAEFERILQDNDLSLHSYVDNQTKDVVFYIDDQKSKKDKGKGKKKEKDKG